MNEPYCPLVYQGSAVAVGSSTGHSLFLVLDPYTKAAIETLEIRWSLN